MEKLRIGFDLALNGYAKSAEELQAELTAFSELFYCLYDLLVLSYHPESGGVDLIDDISFEEATDDSPTASILISLSKPDRYLMREIEDFAARKTEEELSEFSHLVAVRMRREE